MTTRFRLLIGVASLFTISIQSACADDRNDWPCFGGSPGRNMVNTSTKNIREQWDLRPVKDGGNLLWKAQLGTRAFAGPVVANGMVFVGTNNEHPRNSRDTNPKKLNPTTKQPTPIDKGVLMCFRETDGAFLWQHVNDKMDDPVANDWPREGVGSTPFVEGDRIYYVTSRGEVACVDAYGLANGNQGIQDEKYKNPNDADIIWSFDMVKELNVQIHRMACSSPLIVGDLLYVITGNGVDTDKINVPSPKAASFIALNKHTGKLVWSHNSPGENILQGQWSSPSYGEIGGVPQVVFGGGDGWVRAYEPKAGKPLWQFDANPKDTRTNADAANRLNHIIATPVIVGDRVYVGTGQNPQNAEGEADFWCIAPGGKTGVLDAAWHFGGKDEKAKRPWRFGRTISTAAVHDGLLYAVEIEGKLHCLDAKSGRHYWTHDLQSQTWGSPLWVDGKLLIGTLNGDLFVFRHGKELKLLGKTAFNEPIAVAPVVARGVTYVVTDRWLYALK